MEPLGSTIMSRDSGERLGVDVIELGEHARLDGDRLVDLTPAEVKKVNRYIADNDLVNIEEVRVLDGYACLFGRWTIVDVFKL